MSINLEGANLGRRDVLKIGALAPQAVKSTVTDLAENLLTGNIGLSPIELAPGLKGCSNEEWVVVVEITSRIWERLLPVGCQLVLC